MHLSDKSVSYHNYIIKIVLLRYNSYKGGTLNKESLFCLTPLLKYQILNPGIHKCYLIGIHLPLCNKVKDLEMGEIT